MEDLKTLTVKYLRELARKHLGKGHSKLKTRDELVQALKDFLPASLRGDKSEKTAAAVPASPAIAVAATVAKADPGANGETASKTESAAAKTERAAATAAAAKRDSAGASRATAGEKSEKVAAAKVENFPKKQKPASSGDSKTDARDAVEETPEERSPVRGPVQHEAEPLVEGFFVARIVGPEEARRHHMTNDSNRHAVETRSKPVYEEHLGELPASYGDDSAIALPQDPQTVFFYWDFNESTQRRAFDGLPGAKALLRIFDGDALVREQDFALESKSFYVRGLTPGRRYRLEAHAVARDGQSRRIGKSTNLVAVPPEGPSADTTVRFLRAPWSLPVGRMMDAIREGHAKVSETPGALRHYLDMEEWEELGNSETHTRRRTTERWEEIPGRPVNPSDTRRRMLGASDRHQGASGWPSGRK